jgi:hypothetical protein
MASLSNEAFLILSYYGDMKPHPLNHQFALIKMAYRKITDKKFLEIVKKFNRSSIIACYGKDYCKTPFLKRKHVLTNKGDMLLREVSIRRGGNEEYYRDFVRLHKS